MPFNSQWVWSVWQNSKQLLNEKVKNRWCHSSKLNFLSVSENCTALAKVLTGYSPLWTRTSGRPRVYILEPMRTVLWFSRNDIQIYFLINDRNKNNFNILTRTKSKKISNVLISIFVLQPKIQFNQTLCRHKSWFKINFLNRWSISNQNWKIFQILIPLSDQGQSWTKQNLDHLSC